MKGKKQDLDIVEALKKYDTVVHPSEVILPESVRVYRVKVFRTFLKLGVPITKIDHFWDLFEENGYKLTG